MKNSKVTLGRVLVMLVLTVAPCAIVAAAEGAVRVWEAPLVIPTYLVGSPDPNPRFYFGGQSQGAEHRIYPYPAYDNLTSQKVDKTYTMVYLENEYVKVGILPELGGKIFEAIDKTNGYNFFYRQHVIKPALISLLGAWISGGVEWDVPHHHRATSFLPVQYSIEENGDGSKTVWVGELELRDRMRWAIGITMYPGKSYIEAKFRVINRTPVPVSMLCFSNVAVHVDENYQVIFPPSTQHVTYHSKRDFATWPIATTRFNNADFTAGVDVSWYKNHFNSNSMFAWNYADDFLAGYDHGKRAGTMSIADHTMVPGKKFWTWGNGPRGRAEDKELTDSDGPYIELMVGGYSDNQPDYTWMAPYESRHWSQYWYPFREIDGVKNANTEGAVNLEVKGGDVTAGYYTTSAHRGAKVSLKLKDRVLLQQTVDIDPGHPMVMKAMVPNGTDEHDVRAAIEVDGKEIVGYSPVKLQPEEMPKPVAGYGEPSSMKTNEELYLAGLRIEQFHDPAREPEPYWEEALKRDPADARVNVAMGIRAYKKAKYEEAERYLRAAVARITERYTTPKDAEAFYYLGLVLKAQGKLEEAYEKLMRGTWSAGWRSAGYLEAAQIVATKGDVEGALGLLTRAIDADGRNIRALTLKAALLATTGRAEEARPLVKAAADIDPLDVDVIDLRYMVDKSDANLGRLVGTLKAFPATALEVATECMNAGQWRGGRGFLRGFVNGEDSAKVSPLVYYTLAYFSQKAEESAEAQTYLELAQRAKTDDVFPFQREMVEILSWAMEKSPKDARAPYYLGNLLYDWQPERAVKLWEESARRGADFAVVYRNLGMVYGKQNGSREKAIANLEKAVNLGGSATAFYELDRLYEEAGTPPAKRLAVMEEHAKRLDRDDAVSRLIDLKIFAGRYEEAVGLIGSRLFRVWEGGARYNVGESWVNAKVFRGRELLGQKKYREALAEFEQAGAVPENLQGGFGGGGGARQAEVMYWKAVAYEGMGETGKAKEAWTQATSMSTGAAGGRGGRGGGRGGVGFAARGVQSGSYYQGLSLQKLGKAEEAKGVFERLIASGTQALAGAPAIEALGNAEGAAAQRRRVGDAHYAIGLGRLGLGESQKAAEEFGLALKGAPDQVGAKVELAGIAK